MNLDPGDDRAVTGLVRVWGNLQVDGVTTTVNSTTLQVDDVIMTLGVTLLLLLMTTKIVVLSLDIMIHKHV